MKIIDTLVRLLAAARLTRLVTVDEIGDRYIFKPIAVKLRNGIHTTTEQDTFLLEGLECPHCVGFWATALTLVLPDIRPVRFVLRALAASYVVGHLSARLDS